VNHLLEDWANVCPRFKTARRIGLFLDFDRTLAKSRHEQEPLDQDARDTLAALASNARFRITVISGRRRDEIASQVSLADVKCLGLHGAEGRVRALPESRHALAVVRDLLGDIVGLCPGMWLEDKRDILAVHFRDTAAAVQVKADQLVRNIAGRFERWVRVSRGRKVLELIPYELEDKGAAVQQELRSMGWLALPVYVGGDAGDEPAFEALYRGVTIRVGPERKSHAKYRLDNVEQVQLFLERLRREVA
jgi:trehalose 6-phosphate phosphatase